MVEEGEEIYVQVRDELGNTCRRRSAETECTGKMRCTTAGITFLARCSRGAIGILTSMLHGNAGILLFGNAFMILLFLLGEL